MDKVALDASAILAMLLGEPGGDELLAVFDKGSIGISISSVNFCEVITKLVRDGLTLDEALSVVQDLREYVVDFDENQAIRAAGLFPLTSPKGLSLGDRACLALASAEQATAWTTDRAWSSLKLGIPIKLLRS